MLSEYISSFAPGNESGKEFFKIRTSLVNSLAVLWRKPCRPHSLAVIIDEDDYNPRVHGSVMYKIIKRKSQFFIPFIIIILSSPTDAISPSSSSPCRVSIVCSAHHPQVSRLPHETGRRCRCPDYSLFNILMTASIQRPGYNGIDPAEIIKPNGTKWVPYYVHVPIPPTHATKTRPRIRELRRRLHLNMYVLLGRRKSEGIKDVSCPFDGCCCHVWSCELDSAQLSVHKTHPRYVKIRQ